MTEQEMQEIKGEVRRLHERGIIWLKALANAFDLPELYGSPHYLWLTTAASLYEKWLNENYGKEQNFDELMCKLSTNDEEKVHNGEKGGE